MVGLGKRSVEDQYTNGFKYVTKKERAPAKHDLIDLIKETQDLLRNDFTFRFDFVGSDNRNMVTCNPKSNIGFDFDVNLEVNDDGEEYSAEEIKSKIIWALNRVARKYGYDHAEDSTRVITIKVKDWQNSRILYSCDFAIVNNYTDGQGHKRQQYIHFDKKQVSYSWKMQPKGYYMLPEKEQWIKRTGHQNELRELYLDKKDINLDPDKHSRSLYAEAVHEICQRYGYYD